MPLSEAYQRHSEAYLLQAEALTAYTIASL
jgi:hypothetical protein